MKNLAAVLVQTNKPLEILSLGIPKLNLGQVLVRMAYTGLCHSQLNEIRGVRGKDKNLRDLKCVEGTWGRGSNMIADIPRYIEWAQSGKIDFKKMIVHQFDLEQINDGFEKLSHGKLSRALIAM